MREMDELDETPCSHSYEELFEAISKFCTMNPNEEFSLDSLLQYIKQEIEVKFVDSPTIINQLAGSLCHESREGWIPFKIVYKIFLRWFKEQSSTIHFKIMKPALGSETYELCKCSPEMNTSLAFSTLYLSRAGLRSELNQSSSDETSADKDCGRNGSCCKLQNEIESRSREEKIKKHYEKKIDTLNNLLTQSEEDNMTIQNEIDKLKLTCKILKNKEQKWYETEKHLKDHAQKLDILNHLLREQKVAADAELKCLRHELHCKNKEYEDLLTQYIVMEESKAKWSEERKQLLDANLKISLLESALASKDSLLQEKEERISALDATCKELEESLSFKQNHSVSEYETFDSLLLQSVRNDIPFSSPRRISSHLNLSQSSSRANSLKDELEAAMEQRSTFFESVSTQTCENTATETIFPVISKTMSRPTRLTNRGNKASEMLEVIKNNAFVQTSPLNISELSLSDSSQGTSFSSVVKMQLFEVVDASTQIDTVLERRECAIQTEKYRIQRSAKRSSSELSTTPHRIKKICYES